MAPGFSSGGRLTAGGLSWCSPWHEELLEHGVGVSCSCPWAAQEGLTGNALPSLQSGIPSSLGLVLSSGKFSAVAELSAACSGA